MNDGRGNVQGANGEFRAPKLLDGSAVVGEALFRGFLGGAAFEGAIGFVSGDDHKKRVAGSGDHARKQ